MSDLRSYPTSFEIVDFTETLVAVVKQVDGAAAEVEIKASNNAASWRDLAAEVEKCLKAMQLEGDA